MRYQRYSDGVIRDDYPHKFTPGDLRALDRFLQKATAVVPVFEAFRDAGQVVMRHDVDHNLDHAMHLAEWEAERGYRASYYVLPGAWYWNEPSTPSNLRRLEALGHEVGVHNDVMAEAARHGFAGSADGSAFPIGNAEKAAEILREQIAQLRDIGVTVRGTAAHGTPLWREQGIANIWFWASRFEAADFDLEYRDAYHLHSQALYISDNGGKWSSELRQERGRQTHILLHECHLPVEAFGAKVAA